MPQSAGSMIVTWMLLIATAASLLALGRLFVRHAAGETLLAFEPRRPVPWNGWGPTLLLAPFVTGVVSQGLADAPAEPPPARAAEVWIGVATSLLLAAAVHLALQVVGRADRRDLGWPTSWSQARRDIRLGAVGFLAAFFPVYSLQFCLIAMSQTQTVHPLMEKMIQTPSPSMLAAGALAGLVAAPLLEETAFRLLLQGWLERALGVADSRVATEPELGPAFDEALLESPATGADEEAAAAAPTLIAVPANAPVAWGPIVLSAALFGLAHWGHGVAPWSLTLLGAVLGYLYQRTHRILPCIACHFFFNGFSLAMLVASQTIG